MAGHATAYECVPSLNSRPLVVEHRVAPSRVTRPGVQRNQQCLWHMAQLGRDLGRCRYVVQHLTRMKRPVRARLYRSVVFVIIGAGLARTVVPS